MKKISLVALLLSFIVFGLSSCKPNPVGPTVQNLSVGPESITGNGDVTFTAGQSGNGSISTLTISYGGKDSTVNNPSMPWSFTASSLSSGDLSMKAKGTVSNGYIKIVMQGYGTNIGNFRDVDSLNMSSSK